MTVEEKTTSTAPAKQPKASQSYWSLVWWKFKRNRTAVIGGILLLSFYFGFVVIPEFLSPYGLESTSNYAEAAPTKLHFMDSEGKFHFPPFVYGMEKKLDLKTRSRTYVEDTTKIYPVKLFVSGDPYKLLGFIPGDIHLYGVDQKANPEAIVFIMGSDALGRDWFTRVMYGGRLSLLLG